MKSFLISGIKGYKKHISPYFIKSCRFEPTCSDYAADSVQRFGVLKGGVFAIWRILRCNPFSRGGHDPVIKEIEE